MKHKYLFAALAAFILAAIAFSHYSDLANNAYYGCGLHDTCPGYTKFREIADRLMWLAIASGFITFVLALPLAWRFFLRRLKEVSAAIRGQ